MIRGGVILCTCAGLMLLLSCAGPSVGIQVMKPASIDMPGVGKIAVADFQGRDRSGSQVATTLQSMLLKTEHFQILERDKLRRILEEQNLGMSGVVDEATAARVGRLLGVDALIFGEVTMYDIEDKQMEKTVMERRGTGKYRTEEVKDEKTGEVKKVKKEIYEEVPVKKKYWVRLGNVAVNFRVVNTETGVLLAAHSESGSYDSEKTRSFLEVISDTRKLKPKSEILSTLSNNICKKFARMIAPYFVEEKRIIEPGRGRFLEAGFKFARAGLWPEAMDSWRSAIDEAPSNPTAHYNLGLAYEVEGFLEDAEACYRRAVGLSQKKLYMEALSRIRDAQEEQERLQMQRDGRDATEH